MFSIASLRQVGPGALVSAAFIGPGTVTVCTLAGANFGYTLLWALAFATIATIVLQEMAGRLGTIAQHGLGEALRQRLEGSLWRWPLYALVVVSIYAGNAAYEAGNLSGAALGFESLSGAANAFPLAVLCVSATAGIALWHGSYRQLERLLVGLVALMGAAFAGTLIVSRPDPGPLLHGLLVPSLPAGSLITVLALIGTTVVPYNLFLHAAAAKARWRGADDLAAVRSDTIVSIGVGGIISIAIVSTAAAGLFARGLSAENAADMATQLEPLFGATAKVLLGAGLLAAGLSSAITAPLATAFAVGEMFGGGTLARARVSRIVSLSVLLIGCAFAISGVRPLTIILTAQCANGLLLPVIVAFLIYAMNDRRLLGAHVNGVIANTGGGLVFLIALGLGVRLIVSGLDLI